jgi:hypothetical protein
VEKKENYYYCWPDSLWQNSLLLSWQIVFTGNSNIDSMQVYRSMDIGTAGNLWGETGHPSSSH